VAIGPVVETVETGKLYAPFHEKEPYIGIKVVRDVKYGEDPRNVVDIFTPEDGGAARPVLMYVHGGGTVQSVKHTSGGPYYDNVMVFAARHGMVGVNVEYRPVPQVTWPSGPEDIAAAVHFINDNIASHGGDPKRVVLMGHSFGARLVATYVSHPEFFGSMGSGIVGAIFSSSPTYVIKPGDHSAGLIPFFGPDASRYPQEQALPGLLKTDIPFIFWSAELDSPGVIEQAAMLRDALCKSQRGCAKSFVWPKHSHMSEPFSINTPDHQISDQILDFVDSGIVLDRRR
jgi:triacylglycerol lipase